MGCVGWVKRSETQRSKLDALVGWAWTLPFTHPTPSALRNR
jgi:hypothetical protein